ncbi:MAG: DUF952 domain-containing protein [Aggregatilineales bacterium]
MDPIIHIIPRGVWERAQREGIYRGDTFEAEGFIHFSTPTQVEQVANARFRGHTGLQLLIVDPARLRAELRYEPPYESDQSGALFPHLYGPLNLDAVIDVIDFEPNADGSFTLPEALR